MSNNTKRAEVDYEADDDWLSKEWWQQEFPPRYHRYLRNIFVFIVVGNMMSLVAYYVFVYLF